MLTGLGLATALYAAPATVEAKAKVDRFSGSCALRGTAAFQPPATNQQQKLDVRYSGPGTCSGKLDGRPVSDARVRVSARAKADGSCVRAKTLRPGSFQLRFANGTVIRGSYEFDFTGTDGSVTVRGKRSGRASGHGTFANDRTPPDVALRCASGGVRSAPLDIALTTDSPLVSGRRGAGGSRAPGHPRRPLTLDGSCDFTGTVAFDPPLTNTTRPVAQRVRGRGTCSGTLVDHAGVTHELHGAAARYIAGAPAQPGSCSAGTPTGSGVLALRWGRLAFTTSEYRAGAAPFLTLDGRAGGSALLDGRATDDPATLLSKCAGDGIDKAHPTGHLSTTTTISG
jgi:hypothetical protein